MQAVFSYTSTTFFNFQRVTCEEKKEVFGSNAVFCRYDNQISFSIDVLMNRKFYELSFCVI